MWRNEGLWMKAMELKVWVDGVQRIVCGVTEFTTCQEVVIALAQAIGKDKLLIYIMFISPVHGRQMFENELISGECEMKNS